MSRYLNTLGRGTLGIGICDRCRLKFSIEDLKPDPNIPGLRVCKADMDVLDPYRLPPLIETRINLPFVRMDANLAPSPHGYIGSDQDGAFLYMGADGTFYWDIVAR